jgi:hypothetical protein
VSRVVNLNTSSAVVANHVVMVRESWSE